MPKNTFTPGNLFVVYDSAGTLAFCDGEIVRLISNEEDCGIYESLDGLASAELQASQVKLHREVSNAA